MCVFWFSYEVTLTQYVEGGGRAAERESVANVHGDARKFAEITDAIRPCDVQMRSLLVASRGVDKPNAVQLPVVGYVHFVRHLAFQNDVGTGHYVHIARITREIKSLLGLTPTCIRYNRNQAYKEILFILEI